MTPGETITTEVQLLRLADGIFGFREADVWAALQLAGTDAATMAKREAVRAVLQDLVARGKLRVEGGRYWRARA